MAYRPATLDALQNRLIAACTPDLLTPEYRRGWTPENPHFGFCSTASEVMWFVLGGSPAGWHAHVVRDTDGSTHWWLEHDDGTRLDPTVEQYRSVGEVPPYERGLRGSAGGFMGIRRDEASPWGFGRRPSRRAAVLLNRLLEGDGVSPATPAAVAAWVAQWRSPPPPARRARLR